MDGPSEHKELEAEPKEEYYSDESEDATEDSEPMEAVVVITARHSHPSPYKSILRRMYQRDPAWIAVVVEDKIFGERITIGYEIRQG
ncbi:unnamed protein product [Lactuca virosa]|uniref:Uncharacterized protein n=1 Tax=Lactuca virosa TaxID=75947 RepID=A0AAU9LPC0_9ASTR|nr:unnamed protein product [Lactuca virosa]